MKLAIRLLQDALKEQRDLITAISAEISTDAIIGTGELGNIYLPVTVAASDKLAELKRAIEILEDELNS